MKKALLVSAALMALTVSVASAAGINLAWNDCGGPETKVFACNSNTGNNFLFGSFVAPAGVSAMTANEIVIDIQAANAAMPAWWDFKNTGSCRQTALAISFDGTTSAGGSCADYWAGQGAGGIGAYQSMSPNRRRVVAVGAVPPNAAGPLDVDVEYFSFRLGISNAKTVASCVGCAEPVCLVLNSINITQPVGVGDFKLVNSATSNFVTWQGTVAGCPGSVPTQGRTWGQVKALYR